MAFMIHPEGHVFEVKPMEGSFSLGLLGLEQAQALVGGYVERVTIREGSTPFERMYSDLLGSPVFLLVNEDGISKRLPFNKMASDVSGVHRIYGVAIVTTENEFA